MSLLDPKALPSPSGSMAATSIEVLMLRVLLLSFSITNLSVVYALPYSLGV